MTNVIQRLRFRLRAICGLILLRSWRCYLCFGSKVIGADRIKVGRDFSAGKSFWIEAVTQYAGVSYSPTIDIGSGVSIGDFCHIAAIRGVSIGDSVLIGSKVIITDHSHGQYDDSDHSSDPNQKPILRALSSSGCVVIGANVWIGDGVSIIKGVQIGRGAVIGANSVITKDVENNSLVAGNPAVIIKRYDGCRWVKIRSN